MSSIPKEARDAQREAMAVTMIDPGDVIAEGESLAARIIDPERHPCSVREPSIRIWTI